jgi:hypothetical protein
MDGSYRSTQFVRHIVGGTTGNSSLSLSSFFLSLFFFFLSSHSRCLLSSWGDDRDIKPKNVSKLTFFSNSFQTQTPAFFVLVSHTHTFRFSCIVGVKSPSPTTVPSNGYCVVVSTRVPSWQYSWIISDKAYRRIYDDGTPGNTPNFH